MMTMTEPTRKYLTEEEAAAYLNRSVQTIRGWRWKNKGPQFIKDPMGAVHYRQEDLDQWMTGSSKNAGDKEQQR